MNIHPDIIKWLREMGYNGQIPESFVGICNNSTQYIWEQLMQNVRPKQEVEIIRSNIILNRLKTKPLSEQDDFLYKVKEIEEYKKKINVDQKLKVITDMVEGKQYKVDQLSQMCRMKDISLDFLKKKIGENEQRNYLLNAKKNQLELQNLEVKETLTELKNVTPVEREESGTAEEITETLQNCAEKLNKLLGDHQKSVVQKFCKPVSSFTTAKKTLHEKSSVAIYLAKQEQEDFEDIARSCRKLAKPKEIVETNIQRDDKKSKHRLFDFPQIIVEDTEKNSFEQLGVKKLSIDANINSDIILATSKLKQRESLGLLSDSCFDEVDNDSFLLTIEDMSSRFNSNKSEDNVFSSVTNMCQQSNCSDDSVVFNFKIPDKKLVKKIDPVKPEYCDEAVNKELENLLHRANRELVYEMLKKCINNVEMEFTLTWFNSMDKTTQKRFKEDDIAKLKFIHIQTEFKIVQQKRLLKDLVCKVGRKKLEILGSIKTRKNYMEMQEWLEFKIKEVALDASLNALQKEINPAKIMDHNDDNDIQVMLSKIMKIKNEIENKIHLIQLTIGDLYNAQKDIAATRESVLSSIWHIRVFKMDTDWMNPLLEDTWSKEMQVFRNFPLEYQRRCIHTEPKTFYRDLCTDQPYPPDMQMSWEDLHMLTEILESPFSPPETILLNVVKAKIKMDVLKSISNRKSNNFFRVEHKKTYSLEELQHQESYLQFAIDRLKSLMFSSNAGRTLAVGDTTRQAMDIWIEMPMKEFISDKRLVEGNNYQYYQKKLNSFL